MVLLLETIGCLRKRLREIQYELNWNKALTLIFWLILIIIGGSFITGILLEDWSTLTVPIIIFRCVCTLGCGFSICMISTSILEELNIETKILKKQKLQYESEIEKYKNDMNDLKEMEKKKTISNLTGLTEKQIDTLSYYTEKAKQFFKWLIVTKDGEVVASDMKPEYNEEYETWFFDNVARTIQVGKNKKLAKKSKYTLTKIISDGYTSLGI